MPPSAPKPRVFIDGHVGTVGLRIREWLAGRTDIELVSLGEERRKDAEARRELLNTSDLVVLCLPDESARQAVEWIESPRTLVIDASTAHRVAEEWAYGLPELEAGQREVIARSSRVTNPGCYPSAVTLAVRPLRDAGLLPADVPLQIHALSGYSGGGRPKVERWEDPQQGLLSLVYEAPYALDSVHKHIPEMRHYSGLEREPQFIPAVGPFRCGMRVQIPLHAVWLSGGAGGRSPGKEIWEALHARYAGERFVRVRPFAESPGADESALDPRVCNDTNRLEIDVREHPSGHVLLVVILDNLGKGASGVAIQNLNLMLGLPEETALPV